MDGIPTAKGALIVQGPDKSYVFKCPHCKYSTQKKANWYKHTKTHVDKKGHICEICSFACKTSSNMKRHVLTHQNLNAYSCEMCSKAFNQKHNLLRHIKRQHQQKHVSCGSCGKFFLDVEKLSDHMTRKHRGIPGQQKSCNGAGQAEITCNPKIYSCSSCSDFFTDRKSYQQHLKIHGKGAELKYSCTECCFVSDTVSKLHRHKMTHSQAKPYMCALCGYRSNQRSNLVRHMKAKHPGVTDRDKEIQLSPYSSSSPALENMASKLNKPRHQIEQEDGEIIHTNPKENPKDSDLSSISVRQEHSGVVNTGVVQVESLQLESSNLWLPTDDLTVSELMYEADSGNTEGDIQECILLAEDADLTNTEFVIVKEMGSNPKSGLEDMTTVVQTSITGLVCDENNGIGLCQQTMSHCKDQISIRSSANCINPVDEEAVDVRKHGKEETSCVISEIVTDTSRVSSEDIETGTNVVVPNGETSLNEESIFPCRVSTEQDLVTSSDVAELTCEEECVIEGNANEKIHSHTTYSSFDEVKTDKINSECSPKERNISISEILETEKAVEIYMMNKDTVLVQDTENPYVFYHVGREWGMKARGTGDSYMNTLTNQDTQKSVQQLNKNLPGNQQNTHILQSDPTSEQNKLVDYKDICRNKPISASGYNMVKENITDCESESLSRRGQIDQRVLRKISQSDSIGKTKLNRGTESMVKQHMLHSKIQVLGKNKRFGQKLSDFNSGIIKKQKSNVQNGLEGNCILRYKKRKKSCIVDNLKKKSINWRQSRKSFTCSMCKMEFCKAISLFKHVQEQHRGLAQCDDSSNSLSCVMCRYKCKGRLNLLRHLRTHK